MTRRSGESSRDEILARIAALESELKNLRQLYSVPEKHLPAEALPCLSVLIGETRYLVPMAHVQTVEAMAWLEPIAESPPWLLGSLQYGDTLVPVVDLLPRLGCAAGSMDPSRFLLLLGEDKPLGLAADGLGTLVHCLPQEFQAVRADLPQAPFVRASRVGDNHEVAHLLDVEHLAETLLTASELEETQ